MAFAGKTVLITGGSKGIGAAVTSLYVQQGANVAINYSSDQGAADALVTKLGAPDRCLLIKGNCGDLADIDNMIAKTVGKFGKIDILVPCAAILDMVPMDQVTEAMYDRAMAINTKGPFFLAQKAAKHMPPGSRIVFISSSLTDNSAVLPVYLVYNATKGAIEQMTRVLAKTYAAKGINVNCVNPGPTATELFLKDKSDAFIQQISNTIPFKRLGEPDEVAEAIVWMSSPGSRWISGQILRANGAMVV